MQRGFGSKKAGVMHIYSCCRLLFGYMTSVIRAPFGKNEDSMTFETVGQFPLENSVTEELPTLQRSAVDEGEVRLSIRTGGRGVKSG